MVSVRLHSGMERTGTDMKTSARFIAILIALCLIAATGACAAEKETPKKDTSLVEKLKGGEIDWGNEMITATAECPIAPKSEQPNQAIARKNAETWAKGEAIANLLGMIEQTAVSYEAYGKDYIIQNVTLRTRIEGYVRGVQVIDSRKVTDEDGYAAMRVTVGTRLYGKDAPGTLLLREAMKAESPIEGKTLPVVVEIPRETPKPVTPTVKSEIPAVAEQKGPFTSVIIDTRGYNVARAISPKIRTADGSEVWGTLPVTPDFAIDTGIVSYVNSLDAAKKSSRCGGKPLMLKAVGRAGGRAMCDLVIADTDAEFLRSESGKTKFLEQCKVIFIVDPPKPLPAKK